METPLICISFMISDPQDPVTILLFVHSLNPSIHPAPFPMQRASHDSCDGPDRPHQGRCPRAGQPSVPEDEENPLP